MVLVVIYFLELNGLVLIGQGWVEQVEDQVWKFCWFLGCVQVKGDGVVFKCYFCYYVKICSFLVSGNLQIDIMVFFGVVVCDYGVIQIGGNNDYVDVLDDGCQGEDGQELESGLMVSGGDWGLFIYNMCIYKKIGVVVGYFVDQCVGLINWFLVFRIRD